MRTVPPDPPPGPPEPPHRHRERGRASLFVVVVAIAIIAVLGLVVDGTAIMETRSQANQIARQAARVAGQEIDRSSLDSIFIRLRLDAAAAERAGLAALRAAGCTQASSIRVSDATVQATCVMTYEPRLLAFLPTIRVEGHATAQAIHLW